MRYDDWDIILFPTGRDSKIPFKEFKVACHVVPDLELAHIHGAVGVPVMTCFVPGLPPGAGFQISMHCWRRPDLSQFSRAYSKHTDLIKFEARILIDGRLVASTVLDRDVNGPHLITSTCEFTKTGELERLKFPHFRRELLFQNHWRPGDDVGRIKIVISEGFPRDSLSAPIERVKNVVAFSFQHAPLEILENNAIAWPNQAMWQASTFNPIMPVPTYHLDDGPSSHAHSPNRKSAPLRNTKGQGFPTPSTARDVFQNPGTPGFLNTPSLQMPFLDIGGPTAPNAPLYPDPFTEADYMELATSAMNGGANDLLEGLPAWPTNGRRSKQSSDAIMTDYAPLNAPEPMHISGMSLDDDIRSLKVPENTPTGGTDGGQDTPLPSHRVGIMPPDFASSLTQSLLNQPFAATGRHQTASGAEVESGIGKDHRQSTLGGDIAVGTAASIPGLSKSSCDDFSSIIRSLGSESNNSSLTTPGGSEILEQGAARDLGIDILGIGDGNGNGLVNALTKRSRNFTPASVKVIDEEDEPRRVSSHVRGPSISVEDVLLSDACQ
ncbi:hypothetical protein B0J18DRAFT_282340 [Chaetomium sp. MPI-SDFR-AT-0129]|nr:hypothetical protein B0J18DRAFT_282340 [Chaetomium sp. MPI-SDFR-AT-0129]